LRSQARACKREKRRAWRPAPPGLHLLQGVEKEGDFDFGGVGGIGAVDDVGLDVPGEIGPDGAGRRLAVVGGAHEVAIDLDGVVAFQKQGHNGPGAHELGEAVVKGPVFMHCVEGPGLVQGEVQHLHGLDLEAVFFKAADDFAHQPPGHAVGFD
jgi:hypothetical protein